MSRMRFSCVRTVALMAILASLSGAVALGQTGEYLIGPRDLLEIRVFEIPDLNVERRVTEMGVVSLPLLGDLPVSGLTTTGVQQKLETLLTAKYVNRANVTVILKEYGNKPVSIVGAVQKPGSLTISGKWDLLDAISAAGGLTPGAGRKIYVLRKSDNGLSDRLEIATDELFVRSTARWNIPIYPSDVVNVPAKSLVKVFCLGEVKQPGAHEFDIDDRLTLLSVIAKAGGLTDRASRGDIRIKRSSRDGRDVEMTVDYKRIVAGKDPDPALKGDDVVIVKESFF
jgi:polysaccharide biosynthesis/export protein